MKKKSKKQKPILSVKTMGISIDKNEYFEIILSNSNHPENFNKKFK